MSERGKLQLELETVLRPHGVAARNLKGVLNGLHSPYRQSSAHLNETMLGNFVSKFTQILYFAVFAHAQQASDQVTSKFDAWEWVKHHARLYLG